MWIAENIATIFSLKQITSVLDLGAGNGKRSLFSASYGAKVIAIDNQSMPLWQFPKYLKTHPSITFLQADIRDLNLNFNQSFDLILLFNVIVFLKKKFFLEQILPYYLEKLNQWGVLCLSFFFDDDPTMSINQKLSFYVFKDFKLPKGYIIQKQEEKILQDNHIPDGEHEHHVWYIEIIKV